MALSLNPHFYKDEEIDEKECFATGWGKESKGKKIECFHGNQSTIFIASK